MANHRRVTCSKCGGHVEDVGPLSARKRCQACGEGAAAEQQTQLAKRAGPYHEKWVEAMIRHAESLRQLSA